MATTKKVKVNTTTGISEAGIPKIVAAVSAYKEVLTKKVSLTETDKQVQAAIKGITSEADFKTMLADIQRQMLALVNKLDKLTETVQGGVKSQYATDDANNQTFSNAAKSFNQE